MQEDFFFHFSIGWCNFSQNPLQETVLQSGSASEVKRKTLKDTEMEEEKKELQVFFSSSFYQRDLWQVFANQSPTGPDRQNTFPSPSRRGHDVSDAGSSTRHVGQESPFLNMGGYVWSCSIKLACVLSFWSWAAHNVAHVQMFTASFYFLITHTEEIFHVRKMRHKLT